MITRYRMNTKILFSCVKPNGYEGMVCSMKMHFSISPVHLGYME